MSPEAQQIAIAEARGWKQVKQYSTGDPAGQHPNQTDALYGTQGPCIVPDYPFDLNACVELVEHLSSLAFVLVCENGKWRCTFWSPVEEYTALTDSAATAICKAFLRTLNLWTTE